MVSKFSNSPDELSENDKLREFKLSESDCIHRKCQIFMSQMKTWSSWNTQKAMISWK